MSEPLSEYAINHLRGVRTMTTVTQATRVFGGAPSNARAANDAIERSRFQESRISNRMVLSLATVFALYLAACGGGGLKGTYTPQGFSPIDSITFKSGGKVEVSSMGPTTEGTFEIDGDRVRITFAGQTTIFTIDKQGCLDSGAAFGARKFCKGSSTASGG